MRKLCENSKQVQGCNLLRFQTEDNQNIQCSKIIDEVINSHSSMDYALPDYEELQRSQFRQPFLISKKMNFHRRIPSKLIKPKTNQLAANLSEANNLERLKKQVQQIEKQEFISYRSKQYNDKIKKNDNIFKRNQNMNSKVDQQNFPFCLVWKSHKKSSISRVRSTVGIMSSVPKKYYTKPSIKRNYSVDKKQCVPALELRTSQKQKQEEIFSQGSKMKIGLSQGVMIRGRIRCKNKRIGSSFR